jgi:benzoyl-CoA reductase/2-hydroxyglutaryl-CoA dehydratase subunit BcrC/BadD/HgdB
MRRHDDARGALRAARGRLSARRYAEVLSGFHSSGQIDPLEYEASSPPTGIPIALVGGPLPPGDLWLFDEIARNGGRIVLDGSDSGERTLPAPFDRRRIGIDPLGVLTDAYWGTIPDMFQRPNRRLYDWLGQALRESGARGLIVRHYVWCDLWHAEVQRLTEWAAMPVLHLDVERGTLSRERTRTRLQAFLEVLR